MLFLADMGVSGKIVPWLKGHGHDAVQLRDEGPRRLPDEETFEKAVKEGRIVSTFDLDFGEIAAFSRGGRCGVIVFRLRNTTTDHVIRRPDSVLAASPPYLEEGAVVVEQTRHRIRRLPPGTDE